MAPTRPEALVFDLGNVFIQWDRDLLYRHLIADPDERRTFLSEVLTIDVNLRLDAGERFDDVLGEVVDRHPMHRSLIEAFGTRWVETLGEVDAEMIELLTRLKGEVPVYALTNWSRETFPIALERHPWLEVFDGRVVSGEEGVVKPDPRIYQRVIDRFDLDPARVWFTDDSAVNVEGARAAGWQADLFVDASTTVALLRRLGIDP